jgi:hypothetical protein
MGEAMSNLKIYAILICFFLSSLGMVAVPCFGNDGQQIYLSVEDFLQEIDGTWAEAFEYVRDHIRFEPSAYLMKSSQGVLWSGRGNAKEQAFLLLEILQTMGEEARLVSGQLDDAKAPLLVKSIFPQDKKEEYSYASDVPLSDPAKDELLLSQVRAHFWVQIKKDDQWLDLDPAFSSSEPGEVSARQEKTYSRSAVEKNFFPEMTISLSVDREDGREDVLMMADKLQNLSNKPVTLSIATDFEEVEEEGSSGGSPGGVFGGLSRSTSGKKKTKGLEALHRASLKIGDGTEVSGEFKEEVPDPSQKTPAKNPIKRVWLHFRMKAEGKVLLEKERILYEKVEDTDELPLFQRHSILVTSNTVPLESWEGDLRKVTDTGLLEEIKKGIEEVKSEVKSKKDKKVLLNESLSLEEKIGPELGHLINMIFAYSSDSLTDDAGRSLSVYSYFSLPRIIFYSVEGDGENVFTSMDLRQDSVSAISYQGQAVAMEDSFLYGRGVFESVLEGKILELFLGRKALTTAFIMQEASRRKIPIRYYSELEKEELEKLAMPAHTRNRALEAIASGAILIVPDRSVRFEGKNRWGWWQIDPRTREAIGVLDTGLHQAMFQRTVLDTEGMLNSKMGFAIGAITGAVDTQWMLAGMVLKYGELNKQALQEIKDYMKQLKAYMCPEFEKSASVTIASATVIDIEDCYKKEFSWGYEGGVKIEMGWCQAFAKGFACASTSILNYYLSQYE